MLHCSREDVCDGFNPAVRMPREPRQIFVGIVVAEVIKEEKRVVFGRITEPECATQLDTGAFECGFRLGNVLDGSDRHETLLFSGISSSIRRQYTSEWLSSRSK
jgi:hypothetical protein